MAHIKFYDHEVVQKSPDSYQEFEVSPQAILTAWRQSMFAHELLAQDGSVKDQSDMKADVLEKYLQADAAIKYGEDLPKPILGIGIMDNLEIGTGREIVAAARAHNISPIKVHVRNAQAQDIEKLL